MSFSRKKVHKANKNSDPKIHSFIKDEAPNYIEKLSWLKANLQKSAEVINTFDVASSSSSASSSSPPSPVEEQYLDLAGQPLHLTSEVVRTMNALFKVTEELEESSRIKLDATTMSMINFIFQRATSMMRLVPQIDFSKLNLSQTIPVYENDTNEIRNVDRFINTYNMINTFPKNTEEQIDKLDKLYGDFENLTYSSISIILLDLMEDLSNSIKADFILPRVIVSDEFVDENDEKSLDDMLKWERIYNSCETNQTGLHGNSKNSSGDIIYHYVIEATYRQRSEKLSTLCTTLMNFRKMNEFNEDQHHTTNLWSSSILYGNNKKYSKEKLHTFIDEVRVFLQNQSGKKSNEEANYGHCEIMLLCANRSNNIFEDFQSSSKAEHDSTLDMKIDLNFIKQLKHPNIARIMFFYKQCGCLTREICDHKLGGLLTEFGYFSLDVLLDLGIVSERIVMRCALDVANGMAFLHHRGLVHINLLTKNIIYCNTGFKITDIGSLYPLKKRKDPDNDKGSDSDNSISHLFKLRWLKRISRKADVLSYVILLYNIYSNYNLRKMDEPILIKALKTGILVENFRDPIKMILTEALRKRSKIRYITFVEIQKMLEEAINKYSKIASTIDPLEFIECLNVLRRAIPILEPFKQIQIVPQWYMGGMLETQLGFIHHNNKSELREFMQWQNHVNEIRNETVTFLKNSIK